MQTNMKLEYIKALNILRSLFNITLSMAFLFVLLPFVIFALIFYYIKFTVENEAQSNTRG